VPSESLFSGVIETLQKNLNIGSAQHKVLTANIANIDTPNYKAFEVVMDDALKNNDRSTGNIELVRTRPQHLSGHHLSSNGIKIKESDPPAINLRADGNTVDLDKTIGKLAENTLRYRTAAQIIKRKFSGLKNAIQGGSK
jgi:flagellar basal-body rod protein FlgB